MKFLKISDSTTRSPPTKQFESRKMSQYIGRTALAHARTWHHIDVARDPRTLGRLASSIAITLMGKHKPVYHPAQDPGDYVVVSNCQYIYTTGNKMEQKEYKHHTRKPGHMQTKTMEEVVIKKGGSEVLRKAVYGMLPKNKLRKFRMNRLKLFEDSTNPYAQNVIAFHDEQEQPVEPKQA